MLASTLRAVIDGRPVRAGLCRETVAVAVAIAFVAGIALVGAAGWAAADAPVKTAPTVAIEQTSTATGPVWIVRLEAWPNSPVNVSICGDAARRGSQDCDQRGTQTVRIQADGSASTTLAMTPPIGCPCVVRAETLTHDLVVTLPVDLPGVPMLRPEEVPPDPFVVIPARELEVHATVVGNDDSFGDALTASFGGAAARTLVLELHNTGSHDMTGLSMSGAVGPDASTGTPLALPKVAHLGPGERQTLRVPVTLAAPAVGTYVVHGRIAGLESPIVFDAETANMPWALVIGAVLVLVGMVLLVVRRRRARRRRREAVGAPSAAADG